MRFHLLFFCAVSLSAPAVFAQTPPPPALSVAELTAQVVRENPERQFYLEQLRAAHADARLARRWSDPELSLEVGQKRLRDSNRTFADEGTVWSLSVTQTFEWPGRLALRKAIANQQVALAELGIDRFARALEARTAVLGYQLAGAQLQAEAIREVADRFAGLKETFVGREPAGLTPLLETRVIEAGELGLQRRATEAELAVQRALLELNQLRGAAVDAPLRVRAEVPILADPPTDRDLLEAARVSNFEYQSRRLELETQGLELKLARNERLPSVGVSPFVSQDNVGERETIVGLGLSVPLPLGRLDGAAMAGSRARLRQAEVGLEVARRELERKVLLAALTLRTKLAERARWRGDAASHFREAASLAEQHFRVGALPVSTFMELQTSYLDALEALVATQAEALEAAMELQELTGLSLLREEAP